MRIYETLGYSPVAQVLGNWLGEEIRESDSGPNKYLSNFQDSISDFYLPFDDENNFHSQKTKSHYNRIIEWLKIYKKYPESRDNDYFTAKIGFNSLMRISGAWRQQCLLLAADGEEYSSLRYERPTGLDIAKQVNSELARVIPELDSLDPEVRIDYITERSLSVNERDLSLKKSLNEWTIDNRQPSGVPIASFESEPIQTLLEVQRLYLGLEVSQIAVAASFREASVARVPFLHAMNISDNPGVLYPFE